MMDPRAFHALAVELAGGKSPAHLRSATSRAYYSVYNLAAQLLRVFVPISKGAAGHGEVQNCLSASNDLDVVTVGRDLRDLHSSRIRADYRLDVAEPEDLRFVKGILIEAADMLNVLEAAFNGQKAPALKAAI